MTEHSRKKDICECLEMYSKLNHTKDFQNHNGLVTDVYDFVVLDLLDEIKLLQDKIINLGNRK